MKHLLKLICFFLIFSSCEKQSKQDDEIRIGAILSLTGPAGEQGENIRKGIELAVSEAKQNGQNVRLIIEDDGTVPARVVTAFNKLIDQDNVKGVIGGVWDFLAASAYPIAQKREILFITPTNPIEIIPDTFKSSSFITSIAPTLESEFLAMRRFVISHNPKTAVIIFPQLPFGLSKRDAFIKALEELKVDLLEASSFTEDENRGDAMKRASLKLAKLKPDIALVISDYAGLSVLAQENFKLGVNTKILTSQHLDQAILFSKQPKIFKDFYGLYPKIYDENFVSRFEAKFNEKPKVFASHGYDAARLLLAAPGDKFKGVTGDCERGKSLGCKGETVIVEVKGEELREIS